MKWSEKKKHLAETQAYSAKLDSYAKNIGLTKGGFSSWRRHPIANTIYDFWHSVPHSPKWRVEEWSFGPINHTRTTAEGGGIFDYCKRCGLHKDERLYMPLDSSYDNLPGEEAYISERGRDAASSN